MHIIHLSLNTNIIVEYCRPTQVQYFKIYIQYESVLLCLCIGLVCTRQPHDWGPTVYLQWTSLLPAEWTFLFVASRLAQSKLYEWVVTLCWETFILQHVAVMHYIINLSLLYFFLILCNRPNIYLQETYIE